MTMLPPPLHLGPPDPPPTSDGAVLRAILVGLVALTALAGVGVSVLLDRADSALLYVGVPSLIALGVGLLPTRGGIGSVFQVVTVVLLLSSAVLREGAVCVLLVSPLVYGLAALVHGLVRLDGRRRYAVAPLLLLAAEGAWPGLRVDHHQEAEAVHTTAVECDVFAQSLRTGPRFDPRDRGLLLRLSGYPTPETSSGEGVGVGDRWALAFRAGSVTTEVVERDPGRLVFEVRGDDSQTARTVGLEQATLTWEPKDEGCLTRLVIDYERRLDPSFWFGPMTDALMDAGAATFLRALDPAGR